MFSQKRKNLILGLSDSTIGIMKCYVQVGAGAGDLDWSAGFRDGFSKFVKSIELLDRDKVLVVEANRLNIPTLSESWVAISQAEIFNLAITAI